MGRLRPALAVLFATVLTVAAAGCGADDDGNAPAPGRSGGPTGPADVLTESKQTLDLAFKGYFKAPDASTRIAARERKLAIISLSQFAPSAALPVRGAAEAAAAMGWQVKIYDLNFDMARTGTFVDQAIAGGANAIITLADCGYAPDAFARAKAKGILIAPIFAFDCTDPTAAGAPGPSQFTTFLDYGEEQLDNAKFIAFVGAMAASVLIAETKGTAKVIEFTDPYSTILTYTHAGFVAQMSRCTTCQLLETVNLPSVEPVEAQKRLVRDALARHPDATAVRISHSSATQLVIAPVLAELHKQNDLVVFGGEGQPADLDLIRTNGGLDLTISSDTAWFGWAVVDSLNSGFNGEKPKASGMGGILVDKTHNLPPSGSVQHNVDFKDIYRKAWGVN